MQPRHLSLGPRLSPSLLFSIPASSSYSCLCPRLCVCATVRWTNFLRARNWFFRVKLAQHPNASADINDCRRQFRHCGYGYIAPSRTPRNKKRHAVRRERRRRKRGRKSTALIHVGIERSQARVFGAARHRASCTTSRQIFYCSIMHEGARVHSRRDWDVAMDEAAALRC